MALNSLFCADVPLSNYSLTHPKAPPAAQNLMRYENLPGTKIKKLEGQNFS